MNDLISLYRSTGLRYHIWESEASVRLRRSLPRCTSTFILPCTSSFPKSVSVPFFISVSNPSSVTTLTLLLFSTTSNYIYIFRSLFLLTPSQLNCLHINSHINVSIHHLPHLQRSLQRGVRAGVFGRRASPTCAYRVS